MKNFLNTITQTLRSVGIVNDPNSLSRDEEARMEIDARYHASHEAMVDVHREDEQLRYIEEMEELENEFSQLAC
ncbi:hypothetical protein [Vibrio mediterranei]|uniref:hypothetical protein n=1 Tax=Vibrio mediterranei TaxID=689 RepID=UPI0040693A9C